jgi:malonyl-CoA/methylmalonyl-CoA synthetase
MRATLKPKIAFYKVPTLLKTVDELPKNAMGKVTKKALVPLFTSPA